MKRSLLCLFLLVLPACPQQPVRLPAGLTCGRGDVTTYFGEVKKYSRNDSGLTMTVLTDEEKTERLTLKLPAKMMYLGAEFGPKDWPKVEVKKGKLRNGIRVTVWECKSGERLIDWQQPL